MRLYIVQNEWQGFRVNSLPVDYVVHSSPAPGYPHGRLGKGIYDLWKPLIASFRPGILWMDPDVAADPDDLDAMTAAVEQLPADLHTGMVKLWPTSTSRDTWIWSHRPGTLGAPAATQDETAPVIYVSTCFLWIPARLLDLIQVEVASWPWEGFDVALSEAALRAGIGAHAVPACRPKHLHFAAGHHWTPPGG